MQITARWGEEEVAVEVEAECRTLAALKAVLQDALPEVDVGTVCLEVGGRKLADDDDVCGLEAGSVVSLSVTVAVLAAATLREEGRRVDFAGFCTAAQDGDVRLCGLYLDAGVPVESAPLRLACLSNHVDVVRLLLDRGAAVNAEHACDEAPLVLACERGNLKVVRLLLDRGAAIEARGSDGVTCLQKACEQGTLKVVKLLLDRGAEISAALHVVAACPVNNVELARLLLDRGAALDEEDDQGRTVLHKVCLRRNNTEVVKLLLDRGAAAQGSRMFCGATPLHLACAQDNVEVAKLLLSHGAPINARDGCEGDTPLQSACRFNNLRVARLLLDCGAEVDDNVRAVAQKRGNIKMITLLSSKEQERQLEATPCL